MEASGQTKNRVIRTAMQLIASGALTAAITELFGDFIPPATLAVIIMFLVTFAQNWAEDHGVSFPLVPDRN